MTDDKNYLSEKQILKTSAQIWSSIEKIHDEEKHQASDADACDICLNSYPIRIAVWAEAQVRVFTRKELRIPFCDKHQQECDYCLECAKEIRVDERNKIAKISLKYPVPPHAEIKRLAKECVENMREKMPSITVDEEVVCLCRVFWGMGALRQIQGISSDREVATNDAYIKGQLNLIENPQNIEKVARKMFIDTTDEAMNERRNTLLWDNGKYTLEDWGGDDFDYTCTEGEKNKWRRKATELLSLLTASERVLAGESARQPQRNNNPNTPEKPVYIFADDPIVKKRVLYVCKNGVAISMVSGHKFTYTPVNLPLMKSGMPVGIRKETCEFSGVKVSPA